MDAIINFFKNIYQYIVDSFSAIYEWFLSLISSSLNTILQEFVSAIPDLSSYWNNLNDFSIYCSYVNYFFPLEEAGYFIGAYFVFIGVFLTVKYIVKIFIPFVG